MEEHEVMLAQLEERVKSVLGILDQIKEQNSDLQAQIGDLKREGEDLRQTINTQNNRIEGLLYLEGEVEQLRQQKAGVRDQLAHIISILDSATGVVVEESREPQRVVAEPMVASEPEVVEEEDETDIIPAEVLEIVGPEPEMPQQRVPLTPTEIEELESIDEELEEDAFAEEVVFPDIEETQAVPTIEVGIEDTDEPGEPELAGIFELRDLDTEVEFAPEEESALALIYQHGELEESELESMLEDQGFTGIRVKNLVDQIIEKGMRIEQNLLQMRFEKGRFYYRRHPDAAPL